MAEVPTRFTDVQKVKIYKLAKEGKDIDFILEELKKEPNFPKFKSLKNIDVPRQRIIGLINKNPSIPKKFKIIPTGQKGQNLTYQAYSDLKKKVANLYKKQNVKNVSEIAKKLYPEEDITISQRKIRTLLKDAGIRKIGTPTQDLKGTGKTFIDGKKRTDFRRELSDAYVERKSTGNLKDKIEFHHTDSKNLNAKILTSPNRVAYLTKETNAELMPRDAYISKLYDQREALGAKPKNKEKLKTWKKEWDRINKAGNDFVTDPKSKGLLNFKVIDDVNGKVLNVGLDESKTIMRTPDPKIPGLYGADDYLGNKPFKQMTRIEKDKFLDIGKGNYETIKSALLKLNKGDLKKACRALGAFNVGGDVAGCAAAVEADPIKAATALEEIKPTSAALGKVRNAASAFLKFAGKGKGFAIGTGLGVGGGALVKKFMNDDPSTYLTNDAQANAMILDTLDQKEREQRMEAIGDAPELLDEARIGGELAVTGAAIPGASSVYQARRKPFTRIVDGVKKTRPAMGPARAALGPVGKALSGFATPLGIAALTPLNVASSLYQGDSGYEIATDPLNYLAPALAGTMGSLSKEATRGMGATSKLAKTLRLGMSPGAIKMISRRFGLPGLALSSGISLYELADEYKSGRGMFGKKE